MLIWPMFYGEVAQVQGVVVVVRVFFHQCLIYILISSEISFRKYRIDSKVMAIHRESCGSSFLLDVFPVE